MALEERGPAKTLACLIISAVPVLKSTAGLHEFLPPFHDQSIRVLLDRGISHESKEGGPIEAWLFIGSLKKSICLDLAIRNLHHKFLYEAKVE
jgi:hypothetical protein